MCVLDLILVLVVAALTLRIGVQRACGFSAPVRGAGVAAVQSKNDTTMMLALLLH